MKKYFLLFILAAAAFLRLYNLSVNPPSLFGDELDLGYHAYSILHTARDYQGNFLPIHFHSLAEWRTPLYLYSAVPTVAAFGITPLGVRLPAAIFGILSVMAIYLLVKELFSYELRVAGLKQYSSPETRHGETVAILSALLMAIAPWSLQYSRAGFEVTEMLFFLIMGIYLFLKSLDKPQYLWLSVASLALTPWVYSTAKLFTPLLLIFLFLLYRREIWKLPKRYTLYAILAGLVVGVPIAISTLFGGGAQRFNYISIFSDPTMVSEIGNERTTLARIRGEEGAGLSPKLTDRLISNKFTYWGDKFVSNYLQAYSTDFLFIKGDPDPRQSVGTGQLYRIEIIALLSGLAFFFFEKGRDPKVKLLMAFWFVFAAVPSTITVGGGNHATRLILLLPPLIFFISVGWVGLYRIISIRYKKLFAFGVLTLYLVCAVFYFHNYYTTYPWSSERWWHYGWGPAITEIKAIDSGYDRVIISMSGEPAWIFFAGYYQYNPKTWQNEFPIGNDVEVSGFGKISHTGKFYFGSPSKDIQIYGLGRYIDSKTLYLANASEVGANLIMEPNRAPDGLNLIKTIAYPSGEPAFYLFSGVSPK